MTLSKDRADLVDPQRDVVAMDELDWSEVHSREELLETVAFLERRLTIPETVRVGGEDEWHSDRCRVIRVRDRASRITSGRWTKSWGCWMRPRKSSVAKN